MYQRFRARSLKVTLMLSNPDVLISLLIVLAVAFSAWWLARREGRNNPVSTSKLQLDVTGLKERMSIMEVKIEEIVTDVGQLPTTADIASLSERITATKEAADRTEQAVVRIEKLLMKAPS